MHHPGVLHCLKGLGDLDHDLESLVLGEDLALGQVLLEGAAGHPIHFQDEGVEKTEDPVAMHDGGMVETLQDLGLVHESPGRHRVLGQDGLHDLQRHPLAVLFPPGSENLAGSSRPQGRFHNVAWNFGVRKGPGSTKVFEPLLVPAGHGGQGRVESILTDPLEDFHGVPFSQEPLVDQEGEEFLVRG